MRYNLTKQNSTKTERIVYEVLKETKIPFKHRWIISEKEIDFVIGKYALEINGHNQNTDRNELLISNGYTPIHINNSDINVEYIKNLINKLK